MPGSRRRLKLASIALIVAGLSPSTRGLAQINSYGSGLYSSETLSTPPERRHGGYWDSTSENQRRSGRERTGTAAPPASARTSQDASRR